MLKEKVFELIRLHVEEYAVCEEIDENTSLMDDLRMDALDVVELIIKLEKKFGVKIPEELEDAEKVGELLRFLEGVVGPDEMETFSVAIMANRYSSLPLGTASMVTKVESLNEEQARLTAALKFLKVSGFQVQEGADLETISSICEEMGFDLEELEVKLGEDSFPYTKDTLFVK